MIIYNSPAISSINMNKTQKKELKRKNNLNRAPYYASLPQKGLTASAFGISFGSKMSEHKSWGATVQKDKDGNFAGVNFKIFVHPDTEEAKLVVQKANKNKTSKDSSKIKTIKIPMEMAKEQGVFELKLGKEGFDGVKIEPGDRYKFEIKRIGMKKPIEVRDPYAMKRTSFSITEDPFSMTTGNWSEIYDQDFKEWTDKAWQNGKNKAKVSRNAKINGLTPIEGLRIYETHIGTLTKNGKYNDVTDELLGKIKNKGFNAIEIMPVENTYSSNWGYDGVDKLAPNHTYGSPDDLKRLIDRAHAANLNVIMDIVPNHMGAFDENISNAGPYTDGNNAFGKKINLEPKDENPDKESYKQVREYLSNTALNWVNNYHCDGLRLDMTKFVESDNTLKQIVAEVNYHNPDVVMIAEDARGLEKVTKKRPQHEEDRNTAGVSSEDTHCGFIDDIRNNKASLDALGFDSEWNFELQKNITSSIIGCWEGRKQNLEYLYDLIAHNDNKVAYFMSHDDVGNWDGTRFMSKIFSHRLDLESSAVSQTEKVRPNDIEKIRCEKGQNSQLLAHEILKDLVSGKLEGKSFYENPEKLTRKLSVEDIKKTYREALNTQKLALGITYSIPGPKMIFQGDEKGLLSPFRFFRLTNDEDKRMLSKQKGYEGGLAAFNESKLDSIKYAPKYAKGTAAIEKYTTDLAKIVKENSALQNGEVSSLNENNGSSFIHGNRLSDLRQPGQDGYIQTPLLGVHLKNKADNNEIFTVSSFRTFKADGEVNSDRAHSYDGNYGIDFPEGKWKEIINTDDPKYGGEGKFLNKGKTVSGHSNISIPEYGMIYFKRVG